MSDEEDDSSEEEEVASTDPYKKDSMHLLPQDTPINKATLLELDLETQREYIARLQERRVAAYVYVEKAKKAKAICASTNKLSQAVKFEKLAEKLEKLLTKIDADLLKAEKCADEIKVYRMTIGEYD